MIWCVDHDAQRRNLEIHALRCLGNPFGMMEMVSRVKAVLRRVQRAPIEDVYQAGGIAIP